MEARRGAVEEVGGEGGELVGEEGGHARQDEDVGALGRVRVRVRGWVRVRVRVRVRDRGSG